MEAILSRCVSSTGSECLSAPGHEALQPPQQQQPPNSTHASSALNNINIGKNKGKKSIGARPEWRTRYRNGLLENRLFFPATPTQPYPSLTWGVPARDRNRMGMCLAKHSASYHRDGSSLSAVYNIYVA